MVVCACSRHQQAAGHSNPNLTLIFCRYTQPVINGRQDAVEINEGFDIVGLIEENEDYNQVTHHR